MCAHYSVRVHCVSITLNTDGSGLFFSSLFIFIYFVHADIHLCTCFTCSMFNVHSSHCIRCIFSLLTYLMLKKRKQLLALGYIILIIFTRIFLSHSALLKLELMISFKQNEWMNEWHIEKTKKKNNNNIDRNETNERIRWRKLPRRDILCHRSFLMACDKWKHRPWLVSFRKCQIEFI